MKLNYSRRELEALGEPINPELPTRLNRIAGGGGKGSAPPAPDYAGAAEKQAQASMDVTRYQTHANRPTINTPWGTQSWDVNQNFDQAGYDAAMQAYKDSYQAPTQSEGRWVSSGPGGDQGYERVWQPGGSSQGGYGMEMPDRNDFMGEEQWTMNTELAPELQQALDNELAMQSGRSDIALGLMDNAKDAITTPIDYDSMASYADTPTPSAFSFVSGGPEVSKIGNAPELQKSLDVSGVPEVDAMQRAQINDLPQYNQEYVQDVTNQALDYMRPEIQAAQEQLDAKLAAQGVTPGSPAYESARRRLADQQSRDQFNAVRLGMDQANTMYGNQLRGDAQRFGQEFGQNQAMFDSQLARNQNAFNQVFQRGNFTNNALSNEFGMNLAGTTANNQASLGAFNARVNANALNNQYRATNFDQQMAAAGYQNNLRGAQIAEAQMRQQQPLNNINALMTGQQVAMPQMPAFNTAQRAQAPQYLNAANMQGNYAMQAQQMNNASANSMLGGAMGLAGTLGGAYLGNPAAFGFGGGMR